MSRCVRHPWKFRDTQACTRPHRCSDCKRQIPPGDPCIETITIDEGIRTRAVRSVYYCRPCGR